MSSPLLEASGLVCRFGPKEAVKGLDLALHPGDLVGLIGPDGAGKSTTFRMLVGLQRPTAGTLTRTVPDEQVAYVPQVFALAPDLTVMENMKLQAGLYGLKGAGPRIHELLARVDLDRFGDRMDDDADTWSVPLEWAIAETAFEYLRGQVVPNGARENVSDDVTAAKALFDECLGYRAVYMPSPPRPAERLPR